MLESLDDSSTSGSDKSPLLLVSGKLNNLHPKSKCDGVTGLSTSSEDTYDSGLELRIRKSPLIFLCLAVYRKVKGNHGVGLTH